MILSVSQMPKKIEIDLTGPEGNVFVLISYATSLAKQLELPAKEIKEDMMSSDYKHAVEVFDKHFGEYVNLYTSDSQLLD